MAAYVCHWGHLLTLDLLAEIREAEQALQSDAELAAAGLPGAAALYPPASPPTNMPAEHTLWSFIDAQLQPSDAQPAVGTGNSAERISAAAMRAGPPSGKALLLCNLEAEPSQPQDPGGPSVEAAGLWSTYISAPDTTLLKLYHSRGVAFSDQDRLQVKPLI